MSRVKVNSITPFTGQNINFGGHVVPSGSNKTLGAETNAWGELYVSTGSVNFVAPVTLGQPTVTVASLKAGGEAGVTGPTQGMIFTETNNLRGSFSIGRNNIASGTASLAVGSNNTASGIYSHAQGYQTFASGTYSHAEGWGSRALGLDSHAEGNFTLATNTGAHAEGNYTTASGYASHAEGDNTVASGTDAHAEGANTIASGVAAHAEGYYTTASGYASHAEGDRTLANGGWSHAEGSLTTSSGNYSHAGGLGTVAAASYQTVVGKYNTLTNWFETGSVFIVGTGLSDSSRQNGFSVETDGTKPHIVLPTNTSNPSSPKTGSMYFNPSTNMMYIWNGTAWKSASFA